MPLSAHKLNSDENSRRFFVIIAGIIIGFAVGFLLRPDMMGTQASLADTITRGALLEGWDRSIEPLAQKSFNVMLAGGIVGAVVGALFLYLKDLKEK
jgi:hypothetical protein